MGVNSGGGFGAYLPGGFPGGGYNNNWWNMYQQQPDWSGGDMTGWWDAMYGSGGGDVTPRPAGSNPLAWFGWGPGTMWNLGQVNPYQQQQQNGASGGGGGTTTPPGSFSGGSEPGSGGGASGSGWGGSPSGNGGAINPAWKAGGITYVGSGGKDHSIKTVAPHRSNQGAGSGSGYGSGDYNPNWLSDLLTWRAR